MKLIQFIIDYHRVYPQIYTQIIFYMQFQTSLSLVHVLKLFTVDVPSFDQLQSDSMRDGGCSLTIASKNYVYYHHQNRCSDQGLLIEHFQRYTFRSPLG